MMICLSASDQGRSQPEDDCMTTANALLERLSNECAYTPEGSQVQLSVLYTTVMYGASVLSTTVLDTFCHIEFYASLKAPVLTDYRIISLYKLDQGCLH